MRKGRLGKAEPGAAARYTGREQNRQWLQSSAEWCKLRGLHWGLSSLLWNFCILQGLKPGNVQGGDPHGHFPEYINCWGELKGGTVEITQQVILHLVPCPSFRPECKFSDWSAVGRSSHLRLCQR